MFNEKDIIARLANGENPGDIANQFASMLNGVLEKQRAEAEAARQAKMRENAMNGIAERFAEVMYDYFNLVNPDLADKIAEDDTDMTSIAREVLDGLANVLTNFQVSVQEQCDCDSCDKPVGVKITDRNGKRTVENISIEDADAMLDEFLKRFSF
jgi:hypothetical protein